MSKTVVVACKLPHGIVLEHPMNPANTVTLNGRNKSPIIGATYATTAVDADFWEQWLAVNKEFGAIKSGAIFVAKSDADASAMAAEFKDRRTGFEAMQTDGKDPRATGVKTASTKD